MDTNKLTDNYWILIDNYNGTIYYTNELQEEEVFPEQLIYTVNNCSDCYKGDWYDVWDYYKTQRWEMIYVLPEDAYRTKKAHHQRGRQMKYYFKIAELVDFDMIIISPKITKGKCFYAKVNSDNQILDMSPVKEPIPYSWRQDASASIIVVESVDIMEADLVEQDDSTTTISEE